MDLFEKSRPEPAWESERHKFLARLLNCYPGVKLSLDEKKLYLLKLTPFNFTRRQWEDLLDLVIRESAYGFPYIGLLLDYCDDLKRQIAPRIENPFELVEVDGKQVARRINRRKAERRQTSP